MGIYLGIYSMLICRAVVGQVQEEQYDIQAAGFDEFTWSLEKSASRGAG